MSEKETLMQDSRGVSRAMIKYGGSFSEYWDIYLEIYELRMKEEYEE